MNISISYTQTKKMTMKQSTNSNSDIIGLIADIHHGLKSDATIFHDQHKELCSWIVKEFSAKGVTKIIVLGDWFHNRSEINVKTLIEAYNNVKSLASLFKVYLLVGNHDSYQKNSIDISSIYIFESIKNIEIIKQPTTIELNGLHCLLVPWIVDYENFITQIKNGKFGNVDVMFGHFEFQGGQMSGSRFKLKIGDDPKEITKYVSHKIFSGHYHLHDWLNEKIVYIGSPMQSNFGEAEDDKFIWIIDQHWNEEKIQNTFSPKFEKIILSEYVQNREKFKVKDNHVKFIVDKQIDSVKLQKLIDYLQSLSPATFVVVESLPDEELALVDVQVEVDNIPSLIRTFIDEVAKEENWAIEKKDKIQLIIDKMYNEAILT